MYLSWLPLRDNWDDLLRSVKALSPDEMTVVLRQLAGSRMEFSRMVRLDRTVQRLVEKNGGDLPGFEPVRLAILGSATTSHLPAGIRVAGLRRGLNLEMYEAPYGMYWQELMDPASGLYRFRPEVILLALDARHLAGAEGSSMESAIDLMRSGWRRGKETFSCQILQQTLLPVFPNLMGNNEQRLAQSPAAIVASLNERLRPESEQESVDLLALDSFSAIEGLGAWYDAGMWHHSKHEVHPLATQMYGDQVARLIAAGRGRSAKCLVLDLDNTLWGGVIGDDGLEGIVLGQGSGTGEAFVDFQRYAAGLAERGILLAVCSKNDEKNALEPFERHPEMVLKRGQISCFVANWTDKATNLRHIAKSLNIGLDALVFVDDNPVERELIRRELPMVEVPELPEDTAQFAATLAAAGYFEGLRITKEDRVRCQLYQANAERERLKDGVTDMASYLESLRMKLTVAPIDNMSLTRAAQLLNKTNQFNLMTERLTETEVAARSNDAQWVTLQVRLADRFGDNGLIAVLMAHIRGQEAVIETWLMSCRVLGRQVEEACLNALVETCLSRGVKRLVGQYRATDKNGMVREMYGNLGFEQVETEDSGTMRWMLELNRFVPRTVPMQVAATHEAVV